MHDAERARRQVADDRGDQRGDERVVLDAPEHDELEAEHRAGDRRAEHRAEAARDARGEQLPAQLAAEPRSGATMQSARLAPICTAVPSRPALPPKRCVSTVPTSTIGAMRSGISGPSSWIVSMTRLLPALIDSPKRS